MSPSILIKGPRLIDQVSGNTETNMSTSQLQELVRVQLAGMKGWNVISVAAEELLPRSTAIPIPEVRFL